MGNNIMKNNETERAWEYSPEPRLEGLLQASKYLKWKNVENFGETKVIDKVGDNN